MPAKFLRIWIHAVANYVQSCLFCSQYKQVEQQEIKNVLYLSLFKLSFPHGFSTKFAANHQFAQVERQGIHFTVILFKDYKKQDLEKIYTGNFGMSTLGPKKFGGQKDLEAKLTQNRPCYCEIVLTIGVLVGLNIALVVLEWFKIGSRSPQFGSG